VTELDEDVEDCAGVCACSAAVVAIASRENERRAERRRIIVPWYANDQVTTKAHPSTSLRVCDFFDFSTVLSP
jgi:hypothetical protein